MPFTEGELQEMGRELADMVGSEIMDGRLPIEVLRMTADILQEDYRKIVQAAEEIKKELREAGNEKIQRIDF